jgi:hypothetical protein
MSNTMVCAWCDVYCRVECETRDDEGRLVCAWTECAYCGRTELRFGKLGRQTPLPKDKEVWEIASEIEGEGGHA